MVPKIAHRRDLTTLSEDFELVDGEHKFIRTVWAVLDENDVAWRGEKDVRKYYISLSEFEAALQPVPDEWLFPEMRPEFTRAPNDADGEGLYIKRPDITRYDPDGADSALPSIPRVLLDEIRIMELLTKHPHANIVRYHGCRVRRGRVTGLVLDRHDAVLDDLEHDEELRPSLDKDRIMTDIETAVAHLHSLGLAHNDLNPSNIVIEKNKEAILIDFGSCQRFGKELVSTDTPGWIDEDFTSSAREHDLAALPSIKIWLDNVFQGFPTNLPPVPLDGLRSETIEERGLR
jgi:serine/threonine protein kinase